MKTILLIHGPNLNRLGKRDPLHYGMLTLTDIEALTQKAASNLGYTLRTFQSNHEGALIDWIQEHAASAVGIIINAGALTHYSYALHDAIVDTGIPCVEVHLSEVQTREPWRRISVIAPACIATVSGKKEKGYTEAVTILHEHIKNI